MRLGSSLLLPPLSLFDKQTDWNLAQRNTMPRIVRGHRCKSIVWVHAASLGEVKLLLRFLSLLERRNPDDCYVVTAMTRSGVEYLERMKRPSIYAIGFLPLDTISLMRSVLDRFAIARVWLLETELWPSMLYACRLRNIPVGIANARIEERSFRRYKKIRWILSGLTENLDIVLVQNESYAARFRKLGVRKERLHIVGNMKTHVQVRPPRPDIRLRTRQDMCLAPNDVVITAGCLHAGEGAVLKAALEILKKKNRACKCIVVPRHLRESDALVSELGPATVRLRETTTTNAWDVCCIEKLGILEAMYRIASAAVVGGTFIDIGGHNVWEPAQMGIPVFFGPHYHEQRSGCERLLAAGVGFMVTGADKLANGLERTLWSEASTFKAAQALFAEETSLQQSPIEALIP